MAKKRNEKGQFAEGNQAAVGHGRPRKPAPEYLAAVADELTLEDWREIIKSAIGDAKNGDHRAREWVTKMFLDAQKLEAEIRSKDLMASMADAFDSSREDEGTPHLDKMMAERKVKD